tara:strand:+ start:54258 stop:55100 length:843 start_codon:yes stop_codon:yes gene_type:complete
MGHTYVSHPVDDKGYVQWTSTEDETWRTLVTRQRKIVEGVACDEFLEGLDYLAFDEAIPQLPELNAKLEACNGWGVEPVPAIIQPKEFFTLLSRKRFPAATFIRLPEHMDYLQEPDIFHELYGHTPLLTNKPYCDFMQKFGELALKAEPKDRRRLFRLFWFTIEFGLIKTDKGLKAYGGGILSSPGETEYCLTDKSEKTSFDALTALRTPYRIDIMQPMYFVLDSFDDLFEILNQDVFALVEKAKELGDFEPKFPPKDVKKSDQAGSGDDESEEEGAMRC